MESVRAWQSCECQQALERFHRRNFPKKERPGEHTDSQGAAFPIKLPTKIFYHMTAASRMLDILSSLIADALALLITHTVRLAPVHINTSHDCRHSLPPSCAPVAASESPRVRVSISSPSSQPPPTFFRAVSISALSFRSSPGLAPPSSYSALQWPEDTPNGLLWKGKPAGPPGYFFFRPR